MGKKNSFFGAQWIFWVQYLEWPLGKMGALHIGIWYAVVLLFSTLTREIMKIPIMPDSHNASEGISQEQAAM